jgi:outer membrane protein TolC
MKILLFFISLNSFALELETILDSSLKHYPLILEALQEVESAKKKVQSNEGAFDLKFKSKIDKRIEGYYDGESQDYTIEKPLSFLNAKVYTGYRVSEGNYPDYEGKNNTLSDGEARIGASFSLWQNRDIDSTRVELMDSQIESEQKKLKLRLVQMKVMEKAQKAFWEWVASRKVYQINKNLALTAKSRENGLKKKYKAGDIARIYITENRQYILKRESVMIESKNKLLAKGLELSLFLRDEKGRPEFDRIQKSDAPDFKIKDISVINFQKTLEKVASQFPDINTLKQEILKIENEIKMGRNKTRPKIDVNFEVSRDSGIGEKSLDLTENRAMLSIEIPLQTNIGDGKKAAAIAKKKGLEFRKTLLFEQLNIKLRSLINEIETNKQIIANTKQEKEFADILEKAEKEKFNRGASDFFVLNMREQNTADAKIKEIKSLLNYQKAYAEFGAITQQNF